MSEIQAIVQVEIKTKQCTKCEEVRNLTEFHIDVYTKDGRRTVCKYCATIIGKKNRQKLKDHMLAIQSGKPEDMEAFLQKYPPKEKIEITEKKCKKCSEIKEIKFFSKGNDPYGLQYECKRCNSLSKQERNNRPKILPGEMIICNHCNFGKTQDNFWNNKNSRNGLNPNCKDCEKEISENKKNSIVAVPVFNKICQACNVLKLSTEFSKLRGTKDGIKNTCRDCCRKLDIKRKYGITQEQYDKMLADQGGKCAICHLGQDENVIHSVTGKPSALAIDHCHTTGKVRGILCSPCNRALGALRDNPENADRAANYLRESQSK